MFQIEKGVPVAPHGLTKWPFGQMEVGDSFAVPTAKEKALRSSVHNWKNRNGGKFTVRRVDTETVRCWRVA